MSDRNLSLFGPEEVSIKTEEIKIAPPVAWNLYVDGASRGNPGKSGAGVYIFSSDKKMIKRGFYLGLKTNNQAEYLALLLGLFILKQHAKKGDTLAVYSDSQLLVRQLSGMYRVKSPELAPIHALGLVLLRELRGSINHIMREKNPVADAMANEGIDKKQVVPPDFAEYISRHGIYL
jgi:ribonuclease HI